MHDTLLLTQDFPPELGGTQTYAFEIARRLAKRGRLRVVAPYRAGCEEFDAVSGVETVRVAADPNRFFLAARSATLHAARDGFVQAFCVQWSAALPALAARRRFPRFAVHVAAHGRELLFNPLPPPLSAIYDAIRRRVVSRAHGLYPVSRYTADLLRALGAPDSRIRVLPNGTDPDRFRPMDRFLARRRFGLDHHPVILTLCRLVPRKGVDTLLRAFAALQADHPGARLVVGGDGPERNALETLAASLGIAGLTRFVGAVDHALLPELLSAADVFVLVPRERRPDVEGFGLVYLEASACEVPVVGSRTGGIPDAVLDGVSGLLVAPDDPDAVAATVDRILSDPGMARQLAEGGRRHVLDFGNWDRVVDRLVDGLEGR